MCCAPSCVSGKSESESSPPTSGAAAILSLSGLRRLCRTFSTNYQHLSDTEQADMMTVLGKNFFVHVAGKTNDAHLALVEKFKDIGKIQVEFPGESDFLLVFCPVVSEDGTDINVALQSIPEGKPVILVVMHHTFDPERVVAPSRRQVEHPNVKLTVDCLFHERRLLPCNLNGNAWLEIEAFPGFSRPEDTTLVEIPSKRGFKSVDPIVSWKKFFVHVAGKTNDTHLAFVKKIRDIGKTQVKSPEESDFLLVFCPVVSRVGTDINVALQSIPEGKPVILVVMHHTFDPERVVAPSRRQVENPIVKLTVDCLFHERRLLPCNLNNNAWLEIEAFPGFSPPEDTTLVEIPSKRGFKSVDPIVSWKKFFVHVAGKTNDTHLAFVKKIRDIGKTQVKSPEESDFLLVFCPVVSRVGTDINVALQSIPEGKPVILVVMHHTFDPERVVAPSRRQVENPIVKLTVDCLFHERRLLPCNLNNNAWLEIEAFPGFSPPEDTTLVEIPSKRGFKSVDPIVSWKKFFVHVAGKTNDTHLAFVKKIRDIGKIQVEFPGESDFLLVFCPVVSRVGTDINVALQSIPEGKPVILVVMHHTFDPERVVAPSRRQVENPIVKLTVDCLFHEGRLLTCNLNNNAWLEIEAFPGFSRPQDTTFVEIPSEEEFVLVDPIVSLTKFFIHVAGKTNDAHLAFVKKFRDIGKIQVEFPGESDFLLIFCPVVSRVGTDINVALQSIPGGKPAILVVMHHTFDPERVVAPSRRQVENPNVLLTVDCLFHERKLLPCNLNSNAWLEIEAFLGFFPPEDPTLVEIPSKGGIPSQIDFLSRQSWQRRWEIFLHYCRQLMDGVGGVIARMEV